MSIPRTLLIILLSALCACGKKKAAEKPAPSPQDDNGLSYFSMYDYVKDQWNLFHLQPYVLTMLVSRDGKTDSSLVSADTMQLGEIMLAFVKTDISDKKFIGKYNFNVLDEPVSFTRSYYYEANEPDLYTRTLQVTTDPTNGKIKSVFVEAADKGRSVKLYYAPYKVIQVQEISKGKEVKTVYRFPQDESSFDDEPNFDD